MIDRNMQAVQDASAAAVTALLPRLQTGSARVEMDTGACIAVKLSIADGRLVVDFTGTDPQRDDNFNAPTSVVRAAVLYVLRVLVDADVPLNDGFLRPVEIIVPEGSMLAPRRGAAVAAGNVETSQVVTDALFAAFGAMAASQGTMNNLTFGDTDRQYYETIGGGAGAGPCFAGVSAVQTHMTNSRITDPEVIEARYPVIVERFSVRQGSGGRGAFAGGDGIVRALRFRAPLEVGILSSRRRIAPFGLQGGCDGAPGENRLERADGTVEQLPGVAAFDAQPGDRLVVKTPGGGGFGPS